MSRHRRQWLVLSPLGLVLVGLGLSVTGEAGRRKNEGEPWVLYGTVGLICVDAGIALVADGVKHRTLYELESS